VLKHKRLVSIIATIAFCLSFLAPALIAPAPAVAASTYTTIVAQSIDAINTYITTSSLQIDIPEVKALQVGDTLSIHVPSGVTMNNPGPGPVPAPPTDDHKVTFVQPSVAATDLTLAGAATWATVAIPNVRVAAPAKIDSNTVNGLDAGTWVAYAVGSTIIEIKMIAAPGTTGPGRLFVDFTNTLVTDTFDGDIKVNVFTSQGSGFTAGMGQVIAKYVSGTKGTFAGISSVKSMSTGAVAIDTIMIQETYKNSIANLEAIKLKLPAGFKWAGFPLAADGSWAFTGATFAISNPDSRTLVLTAPPAVGVGAFPLGALPSEGRIFAGGLSIQVDDEDVAKKGDVAVDISGNNVTSQSLIVANYVDYSVAVTEKTTKEVTSGKWDTELGSFLIAEGIKDSLIPGRTIKMTLPEGVKWDVAISGSAGVPNYAAASNVITPTLQSGVNFANAVGAVWSVDSSKRVLTLTLPAAIASKSSVLFEKLKVVIDPTFSGDIVLDVAGTAGAAGEVKVATVNPVAKMTANTAPSVQIGLQNQAIADVTIVEGKKEAFNTGIGTDNIRLLLPRGATFNNLPKVEVTEGNISIDDVNYAANKQAIDITIKSTSTQPSTIKLSDMKVTVDRTLPEGELKLAMEAAASTAVAESLFTYLGVKVFNVENVAEVAVGNCITPAPADQGRNASFYIGSTIMNVNGSNIIMDAAPYIKAGRTYVPVRFLGDALGATTEWDADTKTVTVTKGDNTVVLVIGSKTAKVNGADVAMDVAPEITGGRTMLPARYVAEGLGYAVGWNATLQQVVIQ